MTEITEKQLQAVARAIWQSEQIRSGYLLTARAAIEAFLECSSYENSKYKYINNLQFIRTCFAYPEQYDVFVGLTKVAYVRVRWGLVSCFMPDIPGKIVYDCRIGDEYSGEFESENQRTLILTEIAQKIRESLFDEKS